MVIWMFPRIAGVKVESSLGGKGVVRCTVRLTRPLTARERRRLTRLLDIRADGDRLVYVCRPEEVEEREEHLNRALAEMRGPEPGSRKRRRGSLTSSPHPAAG
jgi:hypothetical protein